MTPSRRDVLAGASAIALSVPLFSAVGCIAEAISRAQPAALRDVRLKPSIYLNAVKVNGRYLLSLSADRLLHNFHANAGLEPKAPQYGGWEARGIAGHTLGHYLSACSLHYAQTGDEELRARVSYIVEELVRCQTAHGDGYIGGATVERDGAIVDGKIIFEELRDGEISAGPFDVNGGWVPLYTWHKVQAGLIDAIRLADIVEALPVLTGMADYLETILSGLGEEQMQTLLAAEHGGLNEAFAHTYELTGDRRYLDVAERIRHRAVIDPIMAGEDILSGLHANTQIPKFIGLATLHTLSADPRHARAVRNFHRLVLENHSYVIGGNSEREFFHEPDVIAANLSDRTCEACNTYNMLKLARQLYSWTPDAAWFDDYEKMHINHLMAHQHPETGRFAYFMPLASGSGRTWSQAEESFWCCVGSGMETHAKHGESIYWTIADMLHINLFIPSEFNWRDVGARISLSTKYPLEETVHIRFDEAPASDAKIAIRLPGWCKTPTLAINGEPVMIERKDNYAVIKRRWRRGDEISATFPMTVSREPAPDDGTVAAYRYGPLVLAADLGPSDVPFEGLAPALISNEHSGELQRLKEESLAFRLQAAPQPLILRPFFKHYDRRTAVYIPTISKGEWRMRMDRHKQDRAAAASLDARTVDVIRLGEFDDERAHDFRANQSDVIAFGGRNGRQAWWGVGNYIEFDLARSEAPSRLRALYWGQEINKDFIISIDGERLAEELRPGPEEKDFVAVEYDIPPDLGKGKEKIRVRFETRGTDAPVYECRIVAA